MFEIILLILFCALTWYAGFKSNPERTKKKALWKFIIIPIIILVIALLNK